MVELTARKKKGIAALISGILAIGAGITLIAATQTPSWIPLAIQAIGAVASIFGFMVVYPDTDG